LRKKKNGDLNKFQEVRDRGNKSHKGKEFLATKNQLPNEKSPPTNPQGLVIEGFSAIKEYIRFSPFSIKEIWIDPQSQRGFQEVEDELKKANRLDVPVCRFDRQRIQGAWGWNGGQANAALLTKKTALAEEEGLTLLHKSVRDNECILVLDHIQDPRNLGAIIRSAAFFDVRFVFIPERRQAPMTSVVASTAQGGLALTNVVRVTNLSRLIRELKEKGFWILGADMSGKPINSHTKNMGKTALVLGSEGDGLGHQVKNQCDILVGLPSLSGLDSLNVSVAAGILISQLKL
jgi:23S rRNA (guanosine2251-2'-O)-methyltransferase